jgi:antitoxin component YwqK of YwqJK toxin-antitoxin module
VVLFFLIQKKLHIIFTPMKFLSLGLIPFFLCLSIHAQGEGSFRSFTDVEGREIRARIHNTDGQNVMLELQDGQGYMTTVDVFSLDDQDYIQKWRPKPPEEASGAEIDESEVEIRDGLYYKIGEQTPHTGVLVTKFVDDTYKARFGLNYGLQHGPSTIWYDTGNKMTKAVFMEGIQHGLTLFWYETGAKKIESAYENGRQHGITTFWYKNGQKRSEGLWNRGQRELIHTKWYENGLKMSEIEYKGGLPHGQGSAWYDNDKNKMKGTWKSGYKDGLYTEWHENGQKKMEVTYVDGVVEGKPLYWNEKGKKLRKKPVDALASSSNDSKVEKPQPKGRGPVLVSAKGADNYFIRYFGMISIPKDMVWNSTLTDPADPLDGRQFGHGVELGNGFSIGTAWGRNFGIYRAELEANYSSYQPEGIIYHLPEGRGDIRGPAEGDLLFYSLMLNNLLDFELTPTMEIFGGAGIGFTYSDINIHRESSSTISANGLNFAYQFLTGMKYNVSGPHNLTGGYKYFSSSDVGAFDGTQFHNFEFGYRLDL